MTVFLLALLALLAPLPTRPRQLVVVEALQSPGDTAVYKLSWLAPTVDPLHVTQTTATFYHWQVVFGDTTPRAPLTGTLARGTPATTYGYTNTITYRYPVGLVDTVRIPRPLTDSAGPYTLAVQAAVGGTTTATPYVLGPYATTTQWYVKAKLILPGPPITPRADSACCGPTSLVQPIRFDIRPTPVATSFGAQVQFCVFALLPGRQGIKVHQSWNIPVCEQLFREWLTTAA
jgi:hypothetical protein